MKKATVLFLTIFTISRLYSQSYEIDFAGTGDTTVVDSVIVKNLNQGSSLILKGNDVLKLNFIPTGIENDAFEIKSLQVYPNPATKQAEIQFYLTESSNVMMIVYDLSGRSVIQSNRFLNPGIHKYLVSGLNQGMYIIHISSQNSYNSAKLISQNSLSCEAEIEYVSSNDLQLYQTQTKHLKSTATTINMDYEEGQTLKFTAISKNYSAVVTDVPAENKTITFDFKACSDADGNQYKIVMIGSQLWMEEDLITTKYNDSTDIPLISDSIAWINLTTPAYCWYDNNSGNKDLFGALYNWYTVETGNLCPTSWHVPTDYEWTTLRNYLGGREVAGGKLKEAGTSHWRSPNVGATNESGFTALPSGSRLENAEFYGGNGLGAGWWTTNAYSATNAWYYSVVSYDSGLYKTAVLCTRNCGMSVRCVRD